MVYLQVVDFLADHQMRDKSNTSKKLTLDIKVHTEKLANLLTQIDEKFQVDWEQVSAHNLNYRHSPSSCKTMWQVYLHPSLKRNAWTEEENKRLLYVAQIHNYQNWESIAKSVLKRSDYQCFIQYQTAVCFMDTQRWGRWDKRDDIKLLKLIKKKSINGVIDWNAVASYFPHKPKKSLHQRYIYYLDPKISHGKIRNNYVFIILQSHFCCFQNHSRLKKILYCWQRLKNMEKNSHYFHVHFFQIAQ